MGNEERDEKIKLIEGVFKIDLKENPYRSEDWYGSHFDRLYEMSTGALQNLIRIKSWNTTKKKDKNVMI